MAKLAAFPEPMNVHQYLAFNATRPDKEKWELLKGELFLHEVPTWRHQRIVANLLFALHSRLYKRPREFDVIPGIGVRLSAITSVEPDVMIRPSDDFRGNNCDDNIVAIEVILPTTEFNDLTIKPEEYSLLPTMMHYIAVFPDSHCVHAFARETGWKKIVFTNLGDVIQLKAIGAALPLAEIYDDMTNLLETNQP